MQIARQYRHLPMLSTKVVDNLCTTLSSPLLMTSDSVPPACRTMRALRSWQRPLIAICLLITSYRGSCNIRNGRKPFSCILTGHSVGRLSSTAGSSYDCGFGDSTASYPMRLKGRTGNAWLKAYARHPFSGPACQE